MDLQTDGARDACAEQSSGSSRAVIARVWVERGGQHVVGPSGQLSRLARSDSEHACCRNRGGEQAKLEVPRTHGPRQDSGDWRSPCSKGRIGALGVNVVPQCAVQTRGAKPRWVRREEAMVRSIVSKGVVAGAAVLSAIAASASPALACGGFFC